MPALIAAIFGIFNERKKRRRAQKKWAEFQKKERSQVHENVDFLDKKSD